ncbi:MAG: leucine-rich repeat domain-containing protein, partial [Ureaplasma sp.]|nr:leucine-rich repeat domain-containing protein [Ureaplasma sp.]
MISKKTKIALLTSGAIGGLLATSIALSSCTFEMTSPSNSSSSNDSFATLSRQINWNTISSSNNNKTDTNGTNSQGVFYDDETGLAFTDSSKTVLLGLNPNYNVSDITIPSSVKQIASYYNTTTDANNTTTLTGAFQDQTSLKNVNFSGSNLLTIGSQAFQGCINLNPVSIPSSVTTIGANAFNGAFVNSPNDFNYTASSALSTIGDGAFQNSGLKSIN